MKNLLLFISSLIIFFSFSSSVFAATYEYQIFGGVNDSEFIIEANSSRISTGDKFIFYGNSSSNYMYVDVCTTGNKPSTWVYDARDGGISVSTQVLKVNKACNVSGYQASVYRFTFFIERVSDIGQDRLGLNFTTRLFNETSYNTYFRILNVFGSDTLSYADIEAGQNELIEQQQKEVNENLENINDSLTDESPPNTDGLNGAAGWLPAGPVDSLINLPLSFFNSISRDLGTTCKPVSLPLPYVNKNLTLPCMSSFYEGIKINSFMDWLGLISSGFILFSYLLKLYKWVDDTLTFRENNHLDNWGGV